MATKVKNILIDTATVESTLTVPGNMPVTILYDAVDMEWRTSIQVPDRFASFTSLELWVCQQAVGNLYLKVTCDLVHSGLSPYTSTTGLTAISITAADSVYKLYSIASTAFSSLPTPIDGDILTITVERDGTSGLDTYNTDVLIAGFKLTYTDNVSAPAVEVYDITTLTVVKDFLAIPSTSTTHDDFLQQWLSYLSLEMESINGINNKIKSQTITNEIGNGNGRSKYRPSFYPIVAIGIVGATDAQKLASVQYDNDGTWTDIETDLDNILINNPNLWHLSEQESYNLELTDGTFSEGTKNIRLTYQAGWSTIPGDLLRMCLEKVADFYKQSMRGEGRFGLSSYSKSEGVGSKNTQYLDFTERHQKMLKPYKRRL